MGSVRHRGEGRAGCVFWVAVLGFVLFIGYQAVPIKVKTGDLEQFITRQAETAGGASADQIRRQILKRAKDLDLPVTSKNVEVNKGGGRIVIECSYEVPISLLVHTYRWKFNHRVDRPVFVI